MVSESFLLIPNKLLLNNLLNTVICKATLHEDVSYNFHIKPLKNVFERIFWQIIQDNNVSLYAVIIQHLKSTLELSCAKTVYAFGDEVVDVPVTSVVGEVNSGL